MAKLSVVLKRDDPFEMVVRRDHVLADALRRLDRLSFDPRKKIHVSLVLVHDLGKNVSCKNGKNGPVQVTFVGEEGSDGGGLTREFFTLLSRHCSKYIEPTGCFKQSACSSVL